MRGGGRVETRKGGDDDSGQRVTQETENSSRLARQEATSWPDGQSNPKNETKRSSIRINSAVGGVHSSVFFVVCV